MDLDQALTTLFAGLVPVISSWIVARWNGLMGWLRPRPNWFKIGTYILLTVVLMVAYKFVTAALGFLPASLSSMVVHGLIAGVAGTLIYRIAQRKEHELAGEPVKP
jgi:predicted membrane channel-forming protein YqfA (hemolysin III family)